LPLFRTKASENVQFPPAKTGKNVQFTAQKPCENVQKQKNDPSCPESYFKNQITQHIVTRGQS
jgi:hypothetical protein